MTFKLKALAAAVALVASSGAFALDGSGATKANSSVVFNAWDTAAGVSYTLNTGLHFADLDTPSENTFSKNLATDSNWTSFLSAVTLANVQWDVRAWSLGSTLASTNVILTTVQAGFNVPDAQVTRATLFAGANSESGLANTLLTLSNGQSNLYTPTSGVGDASQAYQIWNSNSSLPQAGSIGDTLDFYKISSAGAPAGAAARVTSITNLVSAWTLTSTGALSYSVAAVPEPSEYAMFAAGLVVLGAVARKRLNQA